MLLHVLSESPLPDEFRATLPGRRRDQEPDIERGEGGNSSLLAVDEQQRNQPAVVRSTDRPFWIMPLKLVLEA